MKLNSINLYKNFFRDNLQVLLLCLVFFATSLYLITNNDKIQLHLFLNQMVGSPFLNAFFYYITYLGDGFFALLIILLLCLYNLRRALYVTLSFLIASLTSQALKRYVFEDAVRPWMIFQDKEQLGLTLVEGVDTHIHNSFPSGHATQAFAVFISMAFASRSPFVKVIFFFLAFFTAFSRVYISQHWLNDIVAGSAIGLLFSMVFYLWFYEHPGLKWLNRSIFKSRNKAADSVE